MAEKTVSVKLIARVESYLAAMAAASSATTGLAATAQTSMTRLGTTMSKVGGSMTRYLTVPLAATGVAATVMAAQWETSFAQMQGLAGVTAEEVDGLQESVLALAGETARGPQELADALYLAKSSGLDAADAMEVVDMAAHGAAAGMGTTSDVVNLLTSVLGSYGSANIDAARAADILTAAVREGRAEPDEMAKALGRVLPIAASMGIEFEEVAAATAFLTNAGLDTDEAVTALRGTMLALLDPTAAARKELEASGTSAAELKAAIDQGGLLGALELLREHGFDTNAEALSGLIEDNRALVGATALLADATGTLTPIMESVADSTGAAGDAFAAVSETDAFKFKQAVVDIQTAMIEIGTIILPVAAKVGAAIGDLAHWFADLPGPIQTVLVIFGGLAAAAGPVLVIAGSLIKNWQTLTSVLRLSTGALSSAGAAIGALGVVAVAAYLGVQYLGQRNKELKARTDEVTAALLDQANKTFQVAFASAGAETAVEGLAAANQALNSSILAGEGGEKIALAMGQLGLQTQDALKWLVLLADQGGTNVASLIALAGAAGATGEEVILLAKAVNSLDETNDEGMRNALVNLAIGMDYTAEEAGALADRLLPTAMAMEELQDQSENMAEDGTLAKAATEFLQLAASSSEAGAAMVLAAEAQSGWGRGSEHSVEVFKKFGELLGASTQATQDAVVGTTGLTTANDALNLAIDRSTKSLEEQEGVAAADVDTMSDLEQGYRDAAHAADVYREAIDLIRNPHRDLLDATEALWAGTIGFNDAIDDNSTSLAYNNEAGLRNRDVLEGRADDIMEVAAAQYAHGASLEEVSAGIDYNTEKLVEQAVAAGFDEDAVRALLRQYGLAPEIVETEMILYGDLTAKEKTEALLAKYDEIPPEIATAIETAIDAGDYEEAQRLLNEITRPRDVGITIDANPAPAIAELNALLARINNSTAYVDMLANAMGGPAHSAAGRYVPSPMVTSVGEAGDEVILPLTNQARMAALLGMPQVGARVAAAMGGGNTTSLPPIIINNNGRDLTPGDVARAIELSRSSS